jgi:hypothetical protein
MLGWTDWLEETAAAARHGKTSKAARFSSKLVTVLLPASMDVWSVGETVEFSKEIPSGNCRFC